MPNCVHTFATLRQVGGIPSARALGWATVAADGRPHRRLPGMDEVRVLVPADLRFGVNERTASDGESALREIAADAPEGVRTGRTRDAAARATELLYRYELRRSTEAAIR